MLKRNKNKKSKGEVTFTLTKVPKSYEEITAEEKWEWAGKLLEVMKPKDFDKSLHYNCPLQKTRGSCSFTALQGCIVIFE